MEVPFKSKLVSSWPFFNSSKILKSNSVNIVDVITSKGYVCAISIHSRFRINRQLGKSLIYIIKRSGPRIVP